RHRGAVYLERTCAVEEELAERMVVIHVDQAEEGRRAPLDEADVAPPQSREVLPPLHGGDDRPSRLSAAHHPHADPGGEDRIDEGGGVAGQEIAGTGEGGAAVAEVGQYVGLLGEGRSPGALADLRAAGDPPGEHLVRGEA